MEQKIIDIFREHKGRYGSRRIYKTIEAQGEKISRYKAGKVMDKFGLKAIQPRSFVPKTTNSRHRYTISPNLLLDRNLPQKINEVWGGRHYLHSPCMLPVRLSCSVDGFMFPQNHWVATGRSYAGSTDHRGI